jgi:hypothetical protein
VAGLNQNPLLPVRRWIALLLTVFLGVILFLDVFVPDYHVDPVVTGSLLGAIVAVVGVEVGRFGGPKE